MWLTLLAALLPWALSLDISQQNVVVRRITSCPDVGYFFERVVSRNSVDLDGTCYLCFCRDDETALCWVRENKRCDSTTLQTSVRRSTRDRRSATALSDIFLRDAVRNLFNVQTPQVCKPYESSYSDGCPPVDWCLGCTVCDCDANGRWDCHVLSFCPGKNGKNQVKKTRIRRARSITASPPNNEKGNSTINLPKNYTHNKLKRAPRKRAVTFKPKQNITRKENIQKSRRDVNNNAIEATPRRLDTKKSSENLIDVRKLNISTEVKHLKIEDLIPPPEITVAADPLVDTNKQIPNYKSMRIFNIVTTVKPKNVTIPKDDKELAQSVVSRFMKALNKMSEKKHAVFKTILKKDADNKPCVQFRNDTQSVNRTNRNKIRDNIKNQKFGRRQPSHKPSQFNNTKIITKNNTKGQEIQKKAKNRRNRNKRQTTGDKYISNDYDKNKIEYKDKKSFEKLNVSNFEKLSKYNYKTNSINREMTTDLNYFKYFPVESDNTKMGKEIKIYTFVDKKPDHETVLKLLDDNVNNKKIVDLEIDIKTNDIEENNEILENTFNPISVPLLQEKDLKFTNHTFTDLQHGLSQNVLINNTTTITNITAKFTHENNTEINFVTITPNILSNETIKDTKENYIKSHNNNEIKTQFIAIRNFLRNLFQNIVNQKSNTSNSVDEQDLKQNGALKYLKQMFHNIFNKHNKSRRWRSYKHHLGKCKNKNSQSFKIAIIKEICQNISLCKITPSKKLILKPKLKELNNETRIIFRCIRIIKGLLHLLEKPIHLKNASVSSLLRNDMQKLNAIFQGMYDESKLSATELQQIAYIKKNTEVFIEAVGKFASTLNDIISIMTYTDRTQSESYLKNRIQSLQQKRKKAVEPPITDIMFQFKKDNFIHNAMMRKIYNIVNNVLQNLRTDVARPQISIDSNVKNDPAAINKYAHKLIENLKKVESLAKYVNTNQRRSKREIFGDTDIDRYAYLFMLLEYLLKQNNPLNRTPENDGIDLLIEAIQSAPDVKPIKKKVLEYTPTPTIPIARKKSSLSRETEQLQEEQNAAVLKNEETQIKKDPIFRTAPLSSLDQSENKSAPKAIPKLLDESEEDEIDEEEFRFKTKTKLRISTTVATVENRDKLNLNDADDKSNTETMKRSKVGLTTFRTDEKRFEDFNDEMDDDIYVNESPSSSTISNTIMITTDTSVVTKLNDLEITTSTPVMRYFNWDNEADELNDINKYSSHLRWTDEESEETNSTTTAMPVTSTKKPERTYTEDVSTLSKYVIVNKVRRRKAQLTPSEILHKKQVDFLKSLDYGVEKSEITDADSDSDSKEVNQMTGSAQVFF